MPELPEVEGYIAGLREHVVGQRLEGTRLGSPFLLRTVEPALEDAHGLELRTAWKLGKRIVLGFERDHFWVLHPMIAGRLRWKTRGAGLPGKAGLLAADFERGTLLLTEQGSKKRASLHILRGENAVRAHDPGGLEVLETDLDTFTRVLKEGGHTLKRALTTPALFSGIGNAWSDEVLWEAGLSPRALARSIQPDAARRLYEALQSVLGGARDRAVERARQAFPDKVTAFQPEMKVHGRYGEPCERCGAKLERVRRARGNEYHYCKVCQG